MKNNFKTRLSYLYKVLQKNLSSENDVVLLPKNPYLIENASILISSYKKITLILYLTKKESLDYEYLLYRIYLLRLAYPIESKIIIYSDSLNNNKISRIEDMEQVNLFDSESDLIRYLLSTYHEKSINKDLLYNIRKTRDENFYRANLIFLSTSNKKTENINIKSYEELKAQYKNENFIRLKNRRIKKFQYFEKESLLTVENFKSNNYFVDNLKTLSFYSFLNNFDVDTNYIQFSNRQLPNTILYDGLYEKSNKINLLNSLSFNNLYLSTVSKNKNFNESFYNFGHRYNDKLQKFRRYYENKNQKY